MRAVRVFLIEDNPADVDLARESLEAGKLQIDLHVATNGEDALEFLMKRREAHDLPDLILMDLNLPGIPGKEVISRLREDPALKRVPVVVLTSSEAERDIIETYNLGANAYVTKPIDLKMFQRVVKSIEEFWFTIVKLPTRMAD